LLCCRAGAAGIDGPEKARTVAVRTANVTGAFPDAVAWEEARVAKPFLVAGKTDAKRANEAQVLRDDTALYVRVRVNDAGLNTHTPVREGQSGSRGVWSNDCVELFLQPRTGGAYFHLAINPRGTLYDATCHDGVSDTSWQSRAVVATGSDTTAWTAELAIPLASLGGAPTLGAQWSFNVGRHRDANDEHSAWAPTGSGFHNPDAFGVVTFAGAACGLKAFGLPSFESGLP